MLPGAHVFSHQQQYNPHGEQAWMHQQSHHQHAQQAAAAAASVAQQQHYNRIAANHNVTVPNIPSHGQDTSIMDNVTEENRRTLAFIADLLSEDTREAALLELSKKREQVPELALILWHSFGKSEKQSVERWNLIYARCYDVSPSRNHLGLYTTKPLATHGCGIQSRLQRTCALTMRCIAQ
jgi:hypothetical protein